MPVSELLSLILLVAGSLWDTQVLPPALQPFVPEGMRPIEVERVDLDGNGRNDFLLVVERLTSTSSTESEGDRTLLLILTNPDGSLRLAARSEGAIPDPDCGGPFGDCFQGIETKARSFTIETYGGSSWRTSTWCTFAYARRERTWTLARIKISTFHVSTPGNVTDTVFTPRDFGKINISAFQYYSVFKLQTPAQ